MWLDMTMCGMGQHQTTCAAGALLLATGDVAVKQMEMTFNETKQEYEEPGTTLYFTRPQSGAVRMLSAVREMYDKLNPRLCLRSKQSRGQLMHAWHVHWCPLT